MNNTVIFTICITTFNRGKKALNLVKTILPDMKSDWKILVLNNNSDSETEYYDEIEKLSIKNKNLSYIKNTVNVHFHGNYLACFEKAISQYIMILSDEDFPNMQLLPKAIEYLLATPRVGILRGSTELMEGVLSGNVIKYDNQYYKAGKEALLGYGLSNNYHSGTIYNRKKMVEYGFVELLKKNLQKQKIYPHLYIELLTITKLDAYRVIDVLSLIGSEQIIKEDGNVSNSSMIYQSPYSFGSRVDQFIDLRDALFETVVLYNNNVDLFIQLYMNLVWKYFYLISSVNMPLYQKTILKESYIIDSFYDVACASILNYPVVLNYEEQIIEIIDNIYSKFKIK